MERRFADGHAYVANLTHKPYGVSIDVAFDDEDCMMKLLVLDPTVDDDADDFDLENAKLRRLTVYDCKRAYSTRYFIVAAVTFEGIGECAGRFCEIRGGHKRPAEPQTVEDEEEV